jgi:hypothetical protein
LIEVLLVTVHHKALNLLIYAPADRSSQRAVTRKWVFTVVPCNLMLSKFYLPTDAQKSCVKRILKFTLKKLLHVSV